MRLIHSQEKGDTLIEVLFAITVFAMVAVGSLTIMNQGTATAQRSLEITLVRQQIDAQAEAIRYIHQAYVAAYQGEGSASTGVAAQWVKMTSKATGKGADGASVFGETDGAVCPSTAPGQKPFILDARTATVWSTTPAMSAPVGMSLPPFSQVIYNDDSSINQAYGLWVEAVPSTSSNNGPGFVDFHIRACWDSPGSMAPMTLGTIVRLYEPR
jgi:type II secretory pathway pseudopilin PulG